MTKLPDDAIQLFYEDDENDRVTRNHINVQVLQLLEDIEYAGSHSSPRGHKVKEATLATLEIDPLYPVMNFEPRKFNWKYFAGEMAWYMMRTRQIDFINNFSSFWKQICPEGVCNSNYGNILLKAHPSTLSKIQGDTVIAGTFVNQMEWVYNSLKNDSNSRQAVAFLNCPYYQYEGNHDFVCTMYLNFWIRDNKLDMKVQMRSNDIFFGLSYDAPWFSTIQQSMYLNLKEIYPDLELGMYYHCADNIHYYERHFEIADKVLEAPLTTPIELKLEKPIFKFNELGNMILSSEGKAYRDEIVRLTESEEFDNLTQEDWKEQVSRLFSIE